MTLKGITINDYLWYIIFKQVQIWIFSKIFSNEAISSNYVLIYGFWTFKKA